MASRENALREALSELEEQRAADLAEDQRRREEASGKSPLVRELLERRRRALSEGMQRAFAQPGQAQALSDRLRGELEQLNTALRTALKQSGLPEDYLQPVCKCAVCRDTGYVGEPVHEQCACLRRRVMEKLYAGEGLRGLAKENFAAFREDIFPDEPVPGRQSTQRGYIRKVRARLEKYADAFDAKTEQGILLCGKSGLGKTFLMNCVAERVLERGYSVVILSAYRVLEELRRWQFGEGDGAAVRDMLSCDLLCLDDLGSEPMLKNVTVSSLYHLINERRSAGKAILLTTNCAPQELYAKYDDRIAARLTDPNRMLVLELYGTDVRRTRPGQRP